MNTQPRRAVITGIGLVCPLGSCPDDLWEGLVARRSAVAEIAWLRDQNERTAVRFAAEARQFRGEIEEFGTLDSQRKKAIRKGLKVMCRECQMGVAAAQLAIWEIVYDARDTATGVTTGQPSGADRTSIGLRSRNT